MKSKILGSILVIGLIVYSSVSCKVEAKTFGELKNELINEEEEMRKNKQNQSLTEKEMQQVNKRIVTIQANIKQTYRDIENLEAEIEELNNNIKEKKEQIKELVSFDQISNSQDAYLEYIFNATDFTDFIYRSAIAEQLTEYNDKLVDQYNNDIETNKKKQKEIEEKRKNLAKEQENLEAEYNKLGNKLDEILDVRADIDDQIKYLKELVDLYTDLGCKDNEDLKTCGKNVLPANTKFFRPLEKGFATSEWSTNRSGTFSGFHSGLDQSVSPNTNVKVYASGTGVVSGITYKTSCGGTYVIVHHRMTNGQTYTTMYMHLAKVLVSKGDTVTKDTVIGIMGGGHKSSTPSNYTPWDTCTTGAHLHFTIATGLYGVDYKTWNAFMSHTFNPRNIVNYPSGRYNWWTDRITKY